MYCHEGVSALVFKTKRGSPLLVYSLVDSSFNQGSRARFPAGSQRTVNSFGAGMPREYYWLSKWGGRRSVCYNLVAVLGP